MIKRLLFIPMTIMILGGCYAEPANGLPEPTIEVVVPAEEKRAQKEAEQKAKEEAEAEAARKAAEEAEAAAKAAMQLDLSESMAFELVEEGDIETYHGEIQVLYIEDEKALEEMYTSEALGPLRDHLEQYTYNTEPGFVGLVSDPGSIYAVCSKLNKLPEEYEPADLVAPDIPFSFSGQDMKRNIRSIPAKALEDMVAASLEEELSIVGVSGYRSYQRQNTIYSYNVSTRGVEATDKVSARPGHSEHQSGLAIDVSTAAVGYSLEESFGETPEGQWLEAHAHEYGFIIRYPKDYITNTGYNYEPWHLRYVGVGVAEFLHRYDATLEMLYATYLKQ